MDTQVGTFQDMVCEVRSALGLTSSQFAQLLGVTPAAVSLWEKGERNPEGPALRLVYALKSQMQQRKPSQAEVKGIVEAISVGAAAFAFIALLGLLFKTE